MEADRNSNPSEDAELEAIFDSVIHCEPAITEDLMYSIERRFSDSEFGIPRRIALAAARQSGAWFKKLSEDEEMARTLADTLDDIERHAGLMRALAEIMEAAHTRMLVAMCAHAKFDPVSKTMAGATH